MLHSLLASNLLKNNWCPIPSSFLIPLEFHTPNSKIHGSLHMNQHILDCFQVNMSRILFHDSWCLNHIESEKHALLIDAMVNPKIKLHKFYILTIPL